MNNASVTKHHKMLMFFKIAEGNSIKYHSIVGGRDALEEVPGEAADVD